MQVVLKSFIDFIRYSLDERTVVPESVKDINWIDFLEFSCRQGIPGLVYGGLERTCVKIPQEVLLEWIGMAEQTKRANAIVNMQCLEVTEFFAQKGYRNCILKGQANALYYPKPELRCPGDIDIWVTTDCKCNWRENRQKMIKMVREMFPKAYFCKHHIELPFFEDTMVEVHYVPCYLNNWWYDHKLQSYVFDEIEQQMSHRVKIALSDNFDTFEIGILTDDFNVVFQMLHMYKHCFTSGNNLKQMVDYYYLLKKKNRKWMNESIIRHFKRFGVLGYVKGVMWVLREKLGLEEEYLITETDEKFGRVLFKDILYRKKKVRHGNISIVAGRLMDNLHLMRFFPIEVLIAPLHLIWLKCWKQTMEN